MMRFWLNLSMALVVLAGALGCRRDDSPGGAEPIPAVTRVAEGDGVVVVVTLDRDEISTSGLARLTVRTSYKAGLALSSPECVGHDGLAIVETVRSPARRRPDGAVEQSWSFALEPNLPGPAIAPGVRLAVRDTREGTLAYVATEPIPIVVVSVLDAGESVEVSELRAVPAPPPAGESIWNRLGAIVGGVSFAAIVFVAIGVVLVVVIRKRLRGSPISAARKRVQSLASDSARMDPQSRNEAIAECSALLKRSIAERTGIMAGAMTGPEVMEACPQLHYIRDLDSLLPDLERALCSGESPDASATKSIFERCERALDELATFVPTGFVETPEVHT